MTTWNLMNTLKMNMTNEKLSKKKRIPRDKWRLKKILAAIDTPESYIVQKERNAKVKIDFTRY